MKNISKFSLAQTGWAVLACFALAACTPSAPEAAKTAAASEPARSVEQVAATPAHVLITLPPGAAVPVDYTKQVAAWKASGQVSDALVLQQFDGPEPANFTTLTVLDFPSEAAYDSWNADAVASLSKDMVVSRVDILTHNETKQKNSPEGIYVVGQYESLVSPQAYKEYTDAYIVPNMSNQMFSGIMTRYTMYLERTPTAGMSNLKTFLVTEYLNQSEFDRKSSVKDAYKVALLSTHPEWTRINGSKAEIRNDMNETLARKVSLD